MATSAATSATASAATGPQAHRRGRVEAYQAGQVRPGVGRVGKAQARRQARHCAKNSRSARDSRRGRPVAGLTGTHQVRAWLANSFPAYSRYATISSAVRTSVSHSSMRTGSR